MLGFQHKNHRKTKFNKYHELGLFIYEDQTEYMLEVLRLIRHFSELLMLLKAIKNAGTLVN